MVYAIIILSSISVLEGIMLFILLKEVRKYKALDKVRSNDTVSNNKYFINKEKSDKEFINTMQEVKKKDEKDSTADITAAATDYNKRMRKLSEEQAKQYDK